MRFHHYRLSRRRELCRSIVVDGDHNALAASHYPSGDRPDQTRQSLACDLARNSSDGEVTRQPPGKRRRTANRAPDNRHAVQEMNSAGQPIVGQRHVMGDIDLILERPRHPPGPVLPDEVVQMAYAETALKLS
jgi:hypothetical protein